jgi:hypothetical protein
VGIGVAERRGEHVNRSYHDLNRMRPVNPARPDPTRWRARATTFAA